MTERVHVSAPAITQVGREASQDVIDVMQAAFHDDPVARFIQPDEAKRPVGIGNFAKMTVRLPADRREVYLAEGGTAAAIWSPPDQWELSIRESRPLLLGMLRTPSRFLVAMRFFSQADRMHPEEPHWYLDLVGTRPEHQGRGIGEALLRPVLDRCDEQGLPVWTYSSNRQNLAFYHRLGFEVLDEVVLMKGAPVVFPIYRRPRS